MGVIFFHQDILMDIERKHTPGPWHIGFSDDRPDDHYHHHYITTVALDPNSTLKLPIVVVSGAQDDWGVHHGIKNPYDSALIVLAPDMLDALIELDRLWDTGVLYSTSYYPQALIQKVRRLITDATTAPPKPDLTE